MNEENVFMQTEIEASEEMRPPGNGNNCNGHKQSIAAGGNGHWSGDGCGCDTLSPSVSIDGYLWVLVVLAVVIIRKKINKQL